MLDTNGKNDKKLEINGGAFLIARQIFESEIWLNKPSSWKIIWIYIFGKVNHSNNKTYKKGEGFFNFSQELKMIGIDITYDNIRHCLQFLKISKMISTTKSTRGMIIKVNNYNKYQTLLNYKSTIKSTNPSTTKAQPKHNESTTINKNGNNERMKKDIIISELSSQVKQIMDIFYKTNPTLNWGNKTTRKACEDLINLMGIDKALEISAFAVAVQGKPYAPVITTPFQLKEKLTQLKAYSDRERTGGAAIIE